MSALKAAPIVAVFIISLVGQGRAVRVLAAGTKTVEACRFAVSPAAEIVSRLPYPADWQVVVVCNENLWVMLMRQSHVQFISDYAFTVQPRRVTFIRSKVFQEHMRYTPEQVLKHEVGHILCRCDSEDKAWAWADKH